MRETQEDIEHLQALLDNSIERAGTFLRRSFQMPEHSLTAQQLIDCWLDVHTVALATVTTRAGISGGKNVGTPIRFRGVRAPGSKVTSSGTANSR